MHSCKKLASAPCAIIISNLKLFLMHWSIQYSRLARMHYTPLMFWKMSLPPFFLRVLPIAGKRERRKMKEREREKELWEVRASPGLAQARFWHRLLSFAFMPVICISSVPAAGPDILESRGTIPQAQISIRTANKHIHISLIITGCIITLKQHIWLHCCIHM